MAPTYPKKIYDAVFHAGILSHMGIVSALSCDGLLNDKQISLSLKRMVSSEQLDKLGASYVLSEVCRAKLGDRERKVYDENHTAATKQRKALAKAKEDGQKRERKRVAKAFKAAQVPVKSDRSALKLGMLAGL